MASLARQRRSAVDFSRTGKGVLFVAPLLLLLLHTPLLSPWRISVNSQMARFNADKAMLDSATISELAQWLRWGREALRTLLADPVIKGNLVLRQEISDALAGRESVGAPVDPDAYRQIPLAAPQPQPEQAVWQTLARDYAWRIKACLPVDSLSNCMLLAKDLNGDAQPEWIMFDFSARSAFVLSKQNGKWVSAGNFYDLPATLDAKKLRETAQSERLSTQPPPWRDLTIDGQRLPFAPDRY